MNIQIFGTKKCQNTRKAERYFKERAIPYHFIVFYQINYGTILKRLSGWKEIIRPYRINVSCKYCRMVEKTAR